MNSAFVVERNVPIDHQDFLHLAIKLRVALFQVVANLVRLDVVVIQDSPDSALARIGQSGKACTFGAFPYKPSQCPDRPQLRRQPMILWLGACDAHYPRLGFITDLGLVGAVVLVLETHLNTCAQRLVHAAVDHGSTEPKSALKFSDRDAIGVAQHHLGTLYLARRCHSRSRKFLERGALLLRQHQRRPFRFSSHDHHLHELKRKHGYYHLFSNCIDGTNY